MHLVVPVCLSIFTPYLVVWTAGLFLRPAVLEHNLALKTAALAVAAGFPLSSDTGTMGSDTGSVLKPAAVLLTATPPDAPMHHQLQSLIDSVQRTKTLVQHAVCSAHRNILNIIADFASALATEQRDTECAQQASEHHLLVMCPNWGTSRVDIPQVERRKRKGANRLVERVFTRHNIYTYFYSEHQQDVCCRRDHGVFMCIRCNARWRRLCRCALAVVATRGNDIVFGCCCRRRPCR